MIKNKQTGFGHIELILVVISITIVMTGFYVWHRSKQVNNNAEAAGRIVDRFPLKTTKARLKAGQQGERWCYWSRSNCHHNYNAADIFVPRNTKVVAAKSGKVIEVKEERGGFGSRVTIRGRNGLVYYYAHLAYGSVTVRKDQKVKYGDTLGLVGASSQANGTPAHLHFDVLPRHYRERTNCSNSSCRNHPFKNVQAGLKTQWDTKRSFQ